MKKTEWVGVRMPSELYEVVTILAQEQDRSLSEMIRFICKSWLTENGHLGKVTAPVYPYKPPQKGKKQKSKHL
jgi:hypothetical protein